MLLLAFGATTLAGCHVFGSRPVHVYGSSILSYSKQLTLGNVIYHADYDDTAPPVQWRPLVFPYVKNWSLFESRSGKMPYIFAHRATLAGKKISKLADVQNTALILDVFESSDPFLAELPALAYRERAKGKDPTTILGFADGHAKSFTKSTSSGIK